MRRTSLVTMWLLGAVLGYLAMGGGTPASGADAKAAPNLLVNGGFEMGRDPWRLDAAGKTEARFAIDETGAAAGRCCARITLGKVDDWGAQFGQEVEGLQQGQTYTFAVMAQSMAGPVKVQLQIEHRAPPYDRAAASDLLTVSKGDWTELHAMFKVEKSFPQGCFAYISCDQTGAEFRVDGFRLYRGDYVPFREAERAEMAAAAVHVFDTGKPSAAALTTESLATRAGWSDLPEDETKHAFAGDTVVMNDRLALVARRGAAGAELYARGPGGYRLRGALSPSADGASIRGVSIVENGPSQGTLDVACSTPAVQSLGIRYELSMGQPFVKTEPLQGTKALALSAPCSYLVLPDFFADDIVIDPADIKAAMAEIPCENFLLHLLPGGDSLLMTVATARDDDARITLGGQTPRRIDRSEIPFGDKGKIWVAAIEAPGVWHEKKVARWDAGKVLPLDWRAPFPAQWRVDWRQADSLTGSWEMAAQQKNGGFEKYGWFTWPDEIPAGRGRWNTVLGWYPYPCWIDLAGQGYLQPLKEKPVQFEGPAVVFPINRVRQTPLDRFTVVDLVRGTLGIGPCEYVLDLEGQGATMKGRATCATRDALKAIYGARQQKSRHDEILTILGEVEVFVKYIRSRIDQYQAFAADTLTWLEQERTQHPEAAAFIDQMETLTKAIQRNYQQRRELIKTPAYVLNLTDKFRKEVLDDNGADALKHCRSITEAIVVVGGNQDELVGESRMAVKVLRQRAALALAADPQAAPLARELRRRTQQVLRNAAVYEAPQH